MTEIGLNAKNGLLRSYMKSILLTSALVLFSFPAFAASAKHGIALHGDPKYPADYKNFEYVNPDAPKGGTINLSAIGSFDSLNPFIIKGNPGDGVGTLVYQTLMEQAYDEPFSMYGLLAESVERAEDNSSVTFNLRTIAKWEDGKPVTADDVVWSFNALMKEGAPFYKAYYADVKEVIAESPTRVTFIFKTKENNELPMIIGQLPVLPKHYFTDGKHQFGVTTLTPPIGSGPYKLSAVAPGRSITYTKVENWWGKDLPVFKGRYNFNQIIYNYFRDQNVGLEAFFAGNYDIQQEMIAKSWATSYNAPPVLDGRIIKQEIANKRPQGSQSWLYNIRKPIFKDREVRKALAYAFDFEWENKQFAYGAYTRTRSFFENSDLASKGLPSGKELEILEKYRGKIPEEVFTTEYNPPKSDGSGANRANLKTAMDILEKAGYKTGADGIRVHEKTGQRLEFEILDANPAFERWTLPFTQNLKKIGVAAKFRPADDAQYQRRIQNFDFDVTSSIIAQSDSPGNEQREFWSSSRADMPGSRNLIGVKDPIIDELVEKIITARTREDLVANTHALDRVLQWNYYVIPQWYYGAWRLAWWAKLDHPSKISGMTPGIVDTWWVKK